MIRLNLQLFAINTKNMVQLNGGASVEYNPPVEKDKKSTGVKPTNTDVSIVDYLKSQGQDSSYNSRAQLAASMGIANYSGTAEQNTAMLNALKNGSTPQTTAQTTAPAAPASSGSAINGVDQAAIDKMQSSFNASSAYQDAMNYTNQLLQQLSSGRTSYTDQIKDLMGQIQNRDKFEYDVDSDMLFQQYLASSMASGKTAMQDTMGQAAALTGGYGSTYATSAANQAYNSYIQDAYNNLPEYYQLALEAYQMEGEEMYNQLAMLNAADVAEYQRMYDAWGANFNNAQQMYQNEYQAWADEVNNAFNYAGLANSDYWNTANFNESVRQFEQNYALQQAQFKQQQEEFEREMNYKSAALLQEQAQFVSMYDLNGDGLVDANDQNVGGSGYGDLNEPSESQMNKALEAYNTGGIESLNQYLNSLPSNVDAELAAKYAAEYGTWDTVENPLPLEQRTFTKIKDTSNFLGGTDGNDKVADQYGNEYKISELPRSLQSALTKLKEGEKYSAK